MTTHMTRNQLDAQSTREVNRLADASRRNSLYMTEPIAIRVIRARTRKGKRQYKALGSGKWY